MHYTSLLALVVVGFVNKAAGGGGPIDTPIDVTPPNLPGGTIAVDAPPGPFFRDFSPPFPTDAWWSGLTVSNQNAHLAGPFPFQSHTTNAGLGFGISDHREFDGTSIHVNTQIDFYASLAGLPDSLDNRKATYWDTQVVCLQYIAGAGTLDTCLVPGSPYMTLDYKNAGILINVEGATTITEFVWVTPGQKARLTLQNGVYYTVYVTSGEAELTVSADAKSLVSPPGTTAVLRFARVKSIAMEPLLDNYASTIPTGVDFRYSIQGDTATTTWTWDVTGGPPSNLLILSWQHHRSLLQGAQYVSQVEYSTLKGPMIGVSGNVWTMRYDLPTISWFPENPIHPSCRSELEKTLESDVASAVEMVPGDFYFWGGAFARVAQLATIAEQLNRPDLVERVVDILKKSVEHWFDPAHVPAAAFETGWGGFINKEGWNNTWVDFGNAYYNDHHFHYGYLMHGGAVIGKYDPAWFAANRQFFMQVARNTGNPSPNDPHYTVTRHMDFFAGHSWASGIANGAGGRDQESTGEAINGYYGLLLLAEVLGDQTLVDWARLLLAIEIKGAQAYWHLYPNIAPEDSPYPEQPFRALTTVGNVMDTQAGAWLFWGMQRIQIAAIQILPLTPIGQFTYDREWMEGVLPYCQEELDDHTLGDEFKCVIHAAYAKVSPEAAYAASSQLFDWGTGNSATNQLYFVATQPSTRDICSTAAATPEGLFSIQDVDSGLYVTLDGFGHLVATTSADVLAAKFELGFKPGGGTIKATSTGMYVTASPAGDSPITASRETVGSYEVFRFVAQGDELYHITAMVNRGLITTTPEGLVNNANSTNGITPSTFRLVEAEHAVPVVLPPTGTLRSVANQRYVDSSQPGGILHTTAPNAGAGSRYAFAKVEPSPDPETPYWTFQSVDTEQYVTANAGGTIPLAAAAPSPQAWEHYQVIGYEGAYIIIHVASGMAVAVQPDDTLQDNTNSISTATLWEITA